MYLAGVKVGSRGWWVFCSICGYGPYSAAVRGTDHASEPGLEYGCYLNQR